MIGQALSHYKIVEKLGSGGMGEVYLAEDSKLGRQVAFKILPPEMASAERLSRFDREAKAVAVLNHPNIVTIYSVEEAEGVHFITMELVRGQTLGELIPRKGLALNKFFDIAIPLADAASAAHQKGITHRDLKPDNIMVNEEGRPKILDFGLAKFKQELAQTGISELPTQSATRAGRILGTVAYMSPEQAEGKPVDHRSDIFSLGIILYTMATGQRPFKGDTTASILSSIIKDKPDSVTQVNPVLPSLLGRIIKRCLAKDPERRYQTAKDVRNELEELKADVDSGEVLDVSPSRRPSRMRPWLAAAMVMFILAVAGILLFVLRPSPETVPQLINPLQVTSAAGVEDHPTWSPDLGRLAYESNQGGNWDIWMTQLGGGEPVNRTADHPGADRYPSWSPDGRQIAFLSQTNQTWSLYTMAAVGGSPRLLISLPLGSFLAVPQWSADGSEISVSVQNSGLNVVEIVSLQTHQSRQISLPQHDGNYCFDLSWSKDGRWFAYVDAIARSAEVTRLWVVSSSGGESIPVTTGSTNDWSPTWSADGRKLFFVSNKGGAMDLWGQSIGEDGKPEGMARAITAGLGIRSVAFSPDGSKLAYSRGRLVSNVWRVPILEERPATWADAEPLTADYAFAETVDVSPDGKRLAVSSDRAGNQDLWILPSEGGEMIQLTTEPTGDWLPQWSPDGKEIAFYAYRSGNRDIWVMPAAGGPARQLTFHPAEDIAPTWSPDGREIAFSSRRNGNRDIWIVGAEGGEPRQVTKHAAGESFTAWSPDGRWLVFDSQRTGVSSFWRVLSAGGEPEPLSEGPGVVGRFSPDGKVLYFTGWGTERAGNLWALSMEDGSEYPVTDLVGRSGRLGWALATDGTYAYFTWWEDLGDIWVMDVADESRE